MNLQIHGALNDARREILSPDALAFLDELNDRFGERRDALLKARKEARARVDRDGSLDFPPETRKIREDDNWKVGPIPKDLQDRRVEITGPVDRKMVINALNSGAKVFMADFEDASSPTWENMIDGQVNMRDAIARTIEHEEKGKKYALGGNDSLATLIVRPRGWHLDEAHITANGKPIPGAFMDFGLFFFHNAKKSLQVGTGPYFYLPKTEAYTETKLWNDIFDWAEQKLGLQHGTIKATVLIETITAAFQMDEILHSLKDYCVGLNCGRWDYIFSFIKVFHKHPRFTLPDRSQVTMTTHFLRSYSQLLIKTCHRRGAFAMGGMAAAIPVKNDEEKNTRAFEAVRKDKEREAGDGHDGTWVAHPALVPVAMEVFDKHLGDSPNQLGKERSDVHVTASDLLQIPEGTITEAGFRANIRVAIEYIEAWLSGRGAVPINNLMEDAATAEISRAQLWQWVHHGAQLENGKKASDEMFDLMLQEEASKLQSELGESFEHGNYRRAVALLDTLVSSKEFADFLTLPGYEILTQEEPSKAA